MREQLTLDLLDWYDCHARCMPWRVAPADRKAGTRPDPYKVWLSEVMLQQTTVAAVKDYFTRFVDRWPRVTDLAAADDGDVMAEWAGLGYYARARNLLKCARRVAELGAFPETQAELMTLPGIGPYTSAAIASIAFDQAAVVLDGNVERVMARLHNDPTPLPGAKAKFTAYAATLTPNLRPGDYAQAVMDLGATICTPRNPACGICPWRVPCLARQAGTTADLPQKTPKKLKPTRYGMAYVLQNSRKDLLLERRPDTGLLGGTLGFPCSDWSDAPTHAAPVKADWQMMGEARHSFTHFHLILSVYRTTSDANPDRGAFYPFAEFDPKTLPTLMRKVFAATSGPSPKSAALT